MTQPSSRASSFVLSGNPALLFVVTTAMATTVATAISTVLWSSREPTHGEPVACACSCEQAEASAPATVPPLEIDGRGALEKDAIRGVVRDRIADIRECYNEGLRTDPALAGAVSVAFTIAEDGETRAVHAASTTLPLPSVVDCMVNAIDDWTFPHPVGGEVDVVYPFVLEPG
jgi:hypothetical protein